MDDVLAATQNEARLSFGLLQRSATICIACVYLCRGGESTQRLSTILCHVHRTAVVPVVRRTGRHPKYQYKIMSFNITAAGAVDREFVYI